MTITGEFWDTHGNKQIDADSEAAHAQASGVPQPGQGEAGDRQTLDDAEAVRLFKAAKTQGEQYMERVLAETWRRSYDHFYNRHGEGSKYGSERWRGRSKIFRPKIRTTALKKDADAASALFNTDIVQVAAQNEGDQAQQASAEINKALLEVRLDQSREQLAVPWFQIAVAAHQTSKITGICISKQYWDYAEEDYEDQEPLHLPDINPDTGEDVLDPMTGEPSVSPVLSDTGEPIMRPVTKQRVLRDRPMCRLFEPENVIRDPGADWMDQGQESSYVILKYSMSVFDVWRMIQPNPRSTVRWREVTLDALKVRAGTSDVGSSGQPQAVRRSRQVSGADPREDFKSQREFNHLWVYEVFIRNESNSWHFWMLAPELILSDPIPVYEAYPWKGGLRPITIGYGTLEAFKLDPMSTVESLSNLQWEMNDLANLRLDGVKQTVNPIMLARRGRSLNMKNLQNRSADTTLMVDDLEKDVAFERPGSIGPEAFEEMERLNIDFDDAAGVFTGGSVQANRQVSETVGGMQMVQGAANGVGEFQLKVWTMSWVEKVLRDFIKLEQWYESDEKVLAIAADKAQLWQKFGIDQVTDELLMQDVTCRVDVGGAADPMIRLQKFGIALNTFLGAVPEARARLKQDEIAKECFGHAGYRNGDQRFLYPGDEQDPRIVKYKQALQQAMQQLEDKKAEQQHEAQQNQMQQQHDAQQKQMQRDHEIEKGRQDIAGKMVLQEIKPVPPSLPPGEGTALQ